MSQCDKSRNPRRRHQAAPPPGLLQAEISTTKGAVESRSNASRTSQISKNRSFTHQGMKKPIKDKRTKHTNHEVYARAREREGIRAALARDTKALRNGERRPSVTSGEILHGKRERIVSQKIFLRPPLPPPPHIYVANLRCTPLAEPENFQTCDQWQTRPWAKSVSGRRDAFADPREIFSGQPIG
jgi:hypothetical protein